MEEQDFFFLKKNNNLSQPEQACQICKLSHEIRISQLK
jgi:hypothetical protein